MENDDWDLFDIVRSCKATTVTTPSTICQTPSPALPITSTTNTTTNNIISPHNTSPFCFDDFTFTQENNTIPISPLKPNDFFELDKLILRSNPRNIIPTPTATNIPTLSTTTTTIPTPSTTTTIISTPSTITIPTHITTNTITNTSFHGSDQNCTLFNFPTLIEQQEMQTSEFTELEKWILQFNPTTTIPISTITAPYPTTPTTITPITTTITTPTTTTPIIPTTTTTMTNYSDNGFNQYPTVSDFPILVEQQQVQQNHNQVSIFDSISCIKTTTTNLHCELNHSLVPQQPQRNHNQGKRKNNKQVTLVRYVQADKISEDPWSWRKYGQKPIKGSPHPRSYFKCSSFNGCFARKKVEKVKTGEDTYVVTYLGEHNHKKQANNRNFVVGTSRNMSSKSRLAVVGEGGCCPNVRNLGSPNAEMLQLEKLESSKAQTIVCKSKTPCQKTELIESSLATSDKAKSPLSVGKLDSPNMMMLQFDESEIPYTENEFIESSNEDDILIPNMTNTLEEFFLDFNNINSGALLH